MTGRAPQDLARDRSERLRRKQAAARGVAVALASTIAAFHIMWVPHKLATAPYMGGLFVALGIGALVAAVLLGVVGPRLAPLAWGFVGFIAAAPFVGYVWSRLSPWPQQEELVGNWGSPLGTESLVVEGLLFVLAVAALAGAFDEGSGAGDPPGERRRRAECPPSGSRGAGGVTAIADTLARSGGRLARLVAVLPMLLLLVMVAAPALGHEQHSEGDAATGDDAPTQQQDGGAHGRTDERLTGTADGDEAAEIPSPTPAYMVIPAATGGAIITIGGWVLLWRRTDTG